MWVITWDSSYYTILGLFNNRPLLITAVFRELFQLFLLFIRTFVFILSPNANAERLTKLTRYD